MKATIVETMVPNTKKTKSIPSKEGKKKKLRKERSLSPILEERRPKRRLVKKLFEASKPIKAKDEVSAIATDPINVANTTVAPAAKGIIMGELESARPPLKVILKGKGKE